MIASVVCAQGLSSLPLCPLIYKGSSAEVYEMLLDFTPDVLVHIFSFLAGDMAYTKLMEANGLDRVRLAPEGPSSFGSWSCLDGHSVCLILPTPNILQSGTKAFNICALHTFTAILEVDPRVWGTESFTKAISLKRLVRYHGEEISTNPMSYNSGLLKFSALLRQEPTAQKIIAGFEERLMEDIMQHGFDDGQEKIFGFNAGNLDTFSIEYKWEGVIWLIPVINKKLYSVIRDNCMSYGARV